MIWVAMLLLQAAPGPDVVERGAVIFTQTCATGYCHGVAGTAGRAPRLRGRPLDAERVSRVVREGISQSAMPGWENRLPEPDLEAVIAYVMSLEQAEEKEPPDMPMPPGAGPADYVDFPGPPEARQGRDRFFDATRRPQCSTCHWAGDRGIAVGPRIAGPGLERQDRFVSLVRASHSRQVLTATLRDGSRFPALRVQQKEGWIKLYDLTTTPPVLRTLEESSVLSLKNEGNWSHQSMTIDYSDEELEKIFSYLTWLESRGR